MRVVTREGLLEGLRRAMNEAGVPAEALAEAAGLAVAEVVMGRLGSGSRRVAVVCGQTTMGAIGLAAACKLVSLGVEVSVIELGQPPKAPSIYHLQRRRALAAGFTLGRRLSDPAARLELAHAAVIVDAIVGPSLRRVPRGEMAQAIEAVNRAPGLVVSVGLPSGVTADSGQVPGPAVEAAATVAFGLPTFGNVLYPAHALGGRLYVTTLSVPPAILEGKGPSCRLGGPVPWPPRRPDGHKGSFGVVLFVAGASSYFGAPAFSAMAAMAAGAGYSILAAPKSVVPHVAAIAPEVVYRPQPETRDGTLAMSAVADLVQESQRADLVVLGPGLSTQHETGAAIRALVERLETPLLIDADGLRALGNALDLVRQRKAPTVLTPHLGELAALTGRPTTDLKTDPVGQARDLARDLGVSVVWKGAHTLVAQPDGEVVINPSGNSGMATAGAGDVLAGVIAAAVGLGLPLPEATVAGVFCHGLAGDLAAEEVGEDGVTARRILDAVPRAVRALRERFDELARDHYGVATIL